jgi:S-adenosylmethionine:tRNA ribosyltransferase-isomerase
MQLSSYDYSLPLALIANEPVFPRDSCRLMVISRERKSITHRNFSDLPGILKKGDVLVFNDSMVIPARIRFSHEGREIEIFLTKRLRNGKWLAIGKPGKLLRKDAGFKITDNLTATVESVREDGQRVVDFSIKGKKFDAILKKVGSTPLPPYIKNSGSSFKDYQTVYAKKRGSVAAPTAGLHFTKRIMTALKNKGIELEFITLHVGLGTFQPIKVENLLDHKMHSEFFSINSGTAKRLNAAKKAGRRVIAVGTTSVRVLECSYDEKHGFKQGFGETDIYIYPGYKWKCTDALITNFHLPKSTLILLTCAFGGKDLILKAYKEAVEEKYRFYSFGDAMFIE